MIERINTGAAPNDGTGDRLRDAFDKANRNFARIDALLDTIEHMPAPRHTVASHRHEEHVLRIVADAPPEFAPTSLGAMWVDTQSGAIFLAVGVGSVRDWRRLQFADAMV